MTDQLPPDCHTILRGVVGSTVHGLALAGTDDRDEMGVCIEPPSHVIGLSHFEQLVYRTAELRTPQKHGRTPKSEPGDLDLTIYSLRKWARLAAAGNPSVLVLLYLPESHIVTITPAGRTLMDHAGLFASKQAAGRFLGYLQAQRQRLMGERGQMRTTRTALIEKHGYDTKFAMHMLRLGFQGVEYLNTGRITLPMPQKERDHCRAVRCGVVALPDVLTAVEMLEAEIQGLRSTSVLPDRPDGEGIDRLLVRLYNESWSERGL